MLQTPILLADVQDMDTPTSGNGHHPVGDGQVTQLCEQPAPSGHERRDKNRELRLGDRWAMAAAFVILVAVGRAVTPKGANASDVRVANPISLGELRSPTVIVQMFSEAGVTTYTVRDSNGRILAERIGATELASQFPNLDLRTIQAGHLMLADPDN